MDITKFLSDPEKLTIIGVLGLIILGGFRKWWVYGWVYEDLKKDKLAADEEGRRWREQSFRMSGTTDTMAGAFEKIATKTARDFWRVIVWFFTRRRGQTDRELAREDLKAQGDRERQYLEKRRVEAEQRVAAQLGALQTEFDVYTDQGH